MTTRDERYWAKVDRGTPADCWEWTAFRNPCGYGIFRGGSNDQLAHRYGYRLAYGEIPDGGQVLHHCDNPPCQNPVHLFLGDPAANAADKVAKGRQARVRQSGETNGQARATETEVLEIRRRYIDGESQQSLARAFGLGQTGISHIVRDRWSHLPLVKVDGSRRRSRGAANPKSKLSAEQVAEIRRAYEAKEASQPKLAALYGVSQHTISRVVRGVAYSHNLDTS